MNKFAGGKSGVSTTIFGTVVVVLIVVAGVGFGLYGSALNGSKIGTITQTTTDMMTPTEVMTSSTTMTQTISVKNAYEFVASSGAMMSNAWLLVVPLGMHQYAVSIQAEGLEVNGTYIVEGAETSGAMMTVPISSERMNMNTTTASEFQSANDGTGLYWIVLNSNLSSVFENIQLYYLTGMSIQNEILVAPATFQVMATTSTTS